MEFVLYCIFLFLIELAYFKIAGYFDIVDKPNQRSSHSKPTIRGGGILFPVAALCWYVQYRQWTYFMIGLILISVISFWDDIAGVSRLGRLLIQFLAVGLVIYDAGILLPWYYCILVFILIVGTINAFNFMDGINGITGMYSLACLSSIAVAFVYMHFTDDMHFIWIEILALIVFLFFNFRKKAICFAGDAGSVSIAFICCFMLIRLSIVMNSTIPILFVSLYGVDSVITIIFRLIRRENIFQAHRSHLYQVLANEYKIDHRLVAGGYFVIQILVNAWALFVFLKMHLPTPFIFMQVFIFLTAGYLFFRIRLQNWKTLTGIIRK